MNASRIDSAAVTTSLLASQKLATGSRTVAAGMARQPIRAITVDALGTLLELVPPAPRLRAGLRERLGVEVSEAEAGRAMKAETLLAAIRFEPFPDTVPALRALRGAGIRLVAASNWDVSLHEQLAATGLTPLLDAALSSAEVGAPKPDPEILLRGLALVGAAPGEALHVGDDVEADVGAALAAGVTPVLIDREGGLDPPPGVCRIASLAELRGLAP